MLSPHELDCVWLCTVRAYIIQFACFFFLNRLSQPGRLCQMFTSIGQLCLFCPSSTALNKTSQMSGCSAIQQTFTLETGLHSLSSWFAQSNTLDEFRNDSYIINLYMLWTFSNVSWQMQLKFFQTQTSYQLIEIQIVFHSNKNHARNIQQIKVYYAHQAKKYNLIQDSNIQVCW